MALRTTLWAALSVFWLQFMTSSVSVPEACPSIRLGPPAVPGSPGAKWKLPVTCSAPGNKHVSRSPFTLKSPSGVNLNTSRLVDGTTLFLLDEKAATGIYKCEAPSGGDLPADCPAARAELHVDRMDIILAISEARHETEVRQCQKEKEALTSQNEARAREIQELRDLNETQARQIRDLTDENTNKEHALQELVARNNAKRREIQQLRNQMSAKTRDNQRLRSQNTAKTREIQHLSTENSNKARIIAKLQRTIKSMCECPDPFWDMPD